jgi:CCR4-NOT transcriptional regulation complex NOT5 subunit
VLKKVDEGVELFDDIWGKVYSAEQQNQKEKYEQDLKKEIKKLQRLRDQIKTWISSSEVKDKDALIEARKLIETKMEDFKVCEKDTKTKTYSKEGLAREDRLDPAEEAKINTTTWLGDYIERLQNEVEEKDFEIEKLSATGKGRKSHKRDIELLIQHITNHKFHIAKLEGLIRLVNNERIEASAVDGIRDDLDYYMDTYKDEEYMSNYEEDFIYETLGLDELDLVIVDRVTQVETPAMAAVLAAVAATGNGTPAVTTANATTGPGAIGSAKKVKRVVPDNKDPHGDDSASAKSAGSKEIKPAKKGVASVIPLTIGRARVASAGTTKSNDAMSKDDRDADSTKSSPSKIINLTVATRPSTVPSLAVTSSPTLTNAPIQNIVTSVSAASSPSINSLNANSGASMAAILKRESEQQAQAAAQQEKERKVCDRYMNVVVLLFTS